MHRPMVCFGAMREVFPRKLHMFTTLTIYRYVATLEARIKALESELRAKHESDKERGPSSLTPETTFSGSQACSRDMPAHTIVPTAEGRPSSSYQSPQIMRQRELSSDHVRTLPMRNTHAFWLMELTLHSIQHGIKVKGLLELTKM